MALSPVHTQRQRADVSPRASRRGGPLWIPSRPSARLSVSPGLLYRVMEVTETGLQRTRHIANLPGHLARLALFKQVPRQFVSRLVKCLTF